MHERRSWELAHDALARNDELGWHLLEHPARLAIRTIDSFCAAWCAACPGCPSWAACRRSPTTRAHYEAAARATLDLADDFEEVRILLEHLDVDAGRRTPSPTCGQRDQWLPLLAHGSDRESMEEWLADAIGEDLLALSDAMPLGWAEARPGAAGRDAAAGGGRQQARGAARLDRRAAARRLCAGRARALAHLLLTGTGSLRKTVNKNLGFPAKCAHKEPFVAWLEGADADAPWVRRLDARDIPDPAFTDAQWRCWARSS